METRRLTETAFQATFTVPMREVTGDEGDVVDIWDYVESVPAGDLGGAGPAAEEVSHVWRDAHDRYDHVLFPLRPDHTYLVIVVDRKQRRVHGHHVLDLATLYGTDSET